MTTWATAILLLLVSGNILPQEPTIAEVTQKMERRYQMIDNVTARFTQDIKFGFSKIEQNFSGSLIMKKPRRYRLESENQTLVTDGSTVWAYSPVNKQVVVDKYKENQNSISPDQFLLNLPSDYYATILGTDKAGSTRRIQLKLVPKDDRSFIRSVKLWVEEDTWNVRKIVMMDVNETETTYTIDDLKLNTSINDTTFTFSPPPGTEVVDLR